LIPEGLHEDLSTSTLSFALKKSLIHAKMPLGSFERALECIEEIDERGFFRLDRFSTFPIEIQRTIDSWLHTFEPVGVGARSVLQCLQWQLCYRQDLKNRMESSELLALLNAFEKEDRAMEFDWTSHLKEPNFEKILSRLYWDPSDHWQRPVTHDRFTEFVDLIVYQEGSEYKVHLNPDLIPQLTLHTWHETLSKRHPLRQHYQQALLFHKMLLTRWGTLERAANYIVAYQQKFFHQGNHGLRPLILSQISQDLGLHESTISRILHNKTILTPFGILDLKKLLSRPIRKTYGELSSHCAVLEVLANCIAHENPNAPYSDQELSNILKKQGYCVARRTIAKYREQLHIASSHHRRSITGESHENYLSYKGPNTH
jgi:RNA polymerase sigma-54 factor